MEQWYLEDFSEDSKHLIVAFGSVRMFHETEKKGFEWQNLFKYKYPDLDFKKLFIADIRNSWWHTRFGSLSGIGPPVLKKFLNEEIEKANVEKILYVGVSMGGYGSVLFGCLTNATKVMAISPQTKLTNNRRKKQLTKKFEGYNIDETYTDLKSVLENTNNDKTIYKIWYGSLNGSDSKAARRISHIKNVNIYPIKSAKHNVITPILKNGVFRKEVEDFLQD